MIVWRVRIADVVPPEQPVLKSLASIGSGAADGAPLFDLKLETNPLPLKTLNEVIPDVRIALVSQGTEIYVTPPGLSKILKFFEAAESTETLDLSSLYDQASSAVADSSKLALASAVEAQQVVDLHVVLSAPRIVLPAKDDEDEDTRMIIADLGVLEMRSVVQSRAEKDLKGLSVEALQERMYDTFVCKLSNMQLLFVERGEDWEAGEQCQRIDLSLDAA